MIAARPAQNNEKGCGRLADGTLAAIKNAANAARPCATAISLFEPASCGLVDGSVRLEMIRNSGANAQNKTAKKKRP
jgi:hypothetical protein